MYQSGSNRGGTYHFNATVINPRSNCSTYVCTYVYMCVCLCLSYMCLCVCVCMYVCMYVCICVCVCIWPYQYHHLEIYLHDLCIHQCTCTLTWTRIVRARACTWGIYTHTPPKETHLESNTKRVLRPDHFQVYKTHNEDGVLGRLGPLRGLLSTRLHPLRPRAKAPFLEY